MKRYEKQELLTAVSAIAMGLFVALFMLTVLLLMGGCTTTKYVPVETVTSRTDTVYSAKLRVDSVIFRDSVAVIQKGDTVLITKYRDRYKVRERVDTLYQAKTDSVRVPYPVERTVYKEKELTAWQRAKMDFGGGAIAVLCIAAIAGAFLWFMRIKRRKQ